MNEHLRTTFYFNYRRGEDFIRDDEGLQCAGLGEAHVKALESARALLSADILTGVLDLDQEIVITATSGDPLISIPFSDAVELRPRSVARSTALR